MKIIEKKSVRYKPFVQATLVRKKKTQQPHPHYSDQQDGPVLGIEEEMVVDQPASGTATGEVLSPRRLEDVEVVSPAPPPTIDLVALHERVVTTVKKKDEIIEDLRQRLEIL